MNIMSFDFNGTDAKQILYSHTSYGHLHSIIMECNHSYSFTYQFFFFIYSDFTYTGDRNSL